MHSFEPSRSSFHQKASQALIFWDCNLNSLISCKFWKTKRESCFWASSSRPELQGLNTITYRKFGADLMEEVQSERDICGCSTGDIQWHKWVELKNLLCDRICVVHLVPISCTGPFWGFILSVAHHHFSWTYALLAKHAHLAPYCPSSWLAAWLGEGPLLI